MPGFFSAIWAKLRCKTGAENIVKKRILCFGDSNTWGAVPGKQDRYADDVRWTGVLQQELGKDFTVIEEGCNGRTTVYDDMVEGRLSGVKYFGPCCESQSPLDLIVLMLGTNDLKTRFSASPGTIATGFNRYADALSIAAMAGEKPKVLLVSPILVDRAYQNNAALCDMFGDHAVERSEKLFAAFREVAAANGWECLNAAEFASASQIDGIHLDEAGHQALGHALAKKVKAVLTDQDNK